MDCATILAYITTIANIVIAIAAIWAVLVSMKSSQRAMEIAESAAQHAAESVEETRKNTRAQIASSLLDDYARPDMLDAINALRQFGDTHKEEVRERFKLDRYKTDEAKKVDFARRRVAHYFEKAAVIARNQLLDGQLLLDVISKNQVEFARWYVEPLEEAINSNYAAHLFSELGHLHGVSKRTFSFQRS